MNNCFDKLTNDNLNKKPLIADFSKPETSEEEGEISCPNSLTLIKVCFIHLITDANP